MSINIKIQSLFTTLLLAALSTHAAPMSTAFTYQGRLNDGAQPANGSYDLKFTLLDAPVGGGLVADPVTNAAVALSSGLFTVTLDFGQNPFGGAERWLELAVCTNGAGVFTTIIPRQKLTATPYALLAAETTSTNVARLDVPNTAMPATAVPVIANGFIVGANILSAGSGYVAPPAVTVNDTTGSGATLTATISGGHVMELTVNNAGSGYLAGTTLTIAPPPSNAYQVFPGVNYFNNPGNTFAGVFTGNGAGLAGLDASQLTSGTVPDGQLAGTYSGALSFNNPGNSLAGSFTGDGSGLTGLNASALASGTVLDSLLSPNVALRDAHQTFIGSNLFIGVLCATNATNKISGVFTGDGSGLTLVNAASVPWTGITGVPASFADGTDNDTTYIAGAGLALNGTVFEVDFFGNGAAVTAARSDHHHDGTYSPLVHTHSAADLVSGTLPDARLAGTYSSALTLNNAANTFNGSFTGDASGLTGLNSRPEPEVPHDYESQTRSTLVWPRAAPPGLPCPGQQVALALDGRIARVTRLPTGLLT